MGLNLRAQSFEVLCGLWAILMLHLAGERMRNTTRNDMNAYVGFVREDS